MTRPATDDQARLLRSGSRWLMLSTIAVGALNYAYTLMLLWPQLIKVLLPLWVVVLVLTVVARTALAWRLLEGRKLPQTADGSRETGAAAVPRREYRDE